MLLLLLAAANHYFILYKSPVTGGREESEVCEFCNFRFVCGYQQPLDNFKILLADANMSGCSIACFRKNKKAYRS